MVGGVHPGTAAAGVSVELRGEPPSSFEQQFGWVPYPCRAEYLRYTAISGYSHVTATTSGSAGQHKDGGVGSCHPHFVSFVCGATYVSASGTGHTSHTNPAGHRQERVILDCVLTQDGQTEAGAFTDISKSPGPASLMWMFGGLTPRRRRLGRLRLRLIVAPLCPVE